MATVVDVANRALDRLGATPVASLDDPGEIAALLRRHFPAARTATLRASPWNCARRRVLLPAAATSPAFDFPNAFAMPEGPDPLRCLRVLHVGHRPEWSRWRVEGRLILTDEVAPLAVQYVGDLQDVTQWDDMLVEAVATRLAQLMAWRVVGSESRSQALGQEWRDLMRQAQRIDAKEQSQDERIVADDWLADRLT